MDFSYLAVQFCYMVNNLILNNLKISLNLLPHLFFPLLQCLLLHWKLNIAEYSEPLPLWFNEIPLKYLPCVIHFHLQPLISCLIKVCASLFLYLEFLLVLNSFQIQVKCLSKESLSHSINNGVCSILFSTHFVYFISPSCKRLLNQSSF